ncbi:MAG: DHH family phosphoesterase, partial [Clostridia bacterium]
MKYTEWRTGVADENAAVEIAKSLSISSLAARVLVARGIDTSDGAADFLSRDIRKLLSPMLMCDMDRALSRINRALEANEKIAVYGDYDADGITACYIMYEYLKSRGADCIYYIPDRMDEGYGVNEGAVDVLAKSGVTLIITVDTGITAVCEVENAAARGIDFIITDHHECRETLPGAVAVINPHRADCDYPFKSLAGVGVAFKLICALEGRILT